MKKIEVDVDMVQKWSHTISRLEEAEKALDGVYKSHLANAKACNFSLCGCDYCKAWRVVLTPPTPETEAGKEKTR